eukprot:scaffold31574_cov124-Isochrysis_galbana.AAC.7
MRQEARGTLTAHTQQHAACNMQTGTVGADGARPTGRAFTATCVGSPKGSGLWVSLALALGWQAKTCRLRRLRLYELVGTFSQCRQHHCAAPGTAGALALGCP